MPNIYRVISLSFVISLLFSAPLLCIQPISVQFEKKQRLAAINFQTERPGIVLKTTSCTPIENRARAAAWARASCRFVPTEAEASLGVDERSEPANLLPAEPGCTRNGGGSEDSGPAAAAEDEVTSAAALNEL